ncbi:MAG TPA: penicillin-binding transpeptidase domain-containing protein [Pyrinomonadaceae bacterium]|nr:penicillin-binding transpeptidase domain-containing protein [Pyrinomonadaceae bacterium]
MTLHSFSPKRGIVFILFIVISLSLSSVVLGKKKSSSSSRNKSAKAQKGKKASARNRSSRRGGKTYARASRRGRGGRMSAREVRRQTAREQASSLKSLQRRLGRPLTKRERIAEMRRIDAAHRRATLEARRRAEAARLAALARERAMRDEVQTFISKDDTTGEDPEVRRVAVNALGNHAGTVVVMDPITGRVYSVVNQEWGMRRGFKPCSTIKLVTGVAGLSENVIPQVDTVGDGYRLDLTAALAHSNNPFFEQVGSKIGFNKMVSYAKELGLGEKTGVNMPYEYSGKLPEMKPGFIERRMFSYADGFEVTPLQLGTLVSAMANGGKLLVPQIPRSAKEQSKLNPKVRRQLPITSEVWQRMVPGMVGAVNYGSGKKAYDPTQTVAGKTGTCIGQNGWVGLFTSYAPLASPRLAVVVIAEGSDGRRHFPAAVAGEIYRELNHRFGTAINMQVVAAADDEEKEVGDSEDGDDAALDSTATKDSTKVTAASGNSVTTAPITTKAASTETQAPKNTVKRVLMPLEKKTVEPAKNNPALPTPSNLPDGSNTTGTEQRPRRAHPNQP